MQIVLCVVSVLFGGLSLLAAVSQIKAKSEKKPLPALTMAVGALILFASVICNIAAWRFDYIIAVLGCAAICAAAIMNGIKSGQFHIQHHIIRITLSVILTVGSIFL